MTDSGGAVEAPRAASATRRRWCRSAAGALLLLLGFGAMAVAGQDVRQPSMPAPGAPIAEASLAADVAAITPGAPFTLAVRLRLPPGWHTYWLNPGEAGAPTHVDWQLPAGFTTAPIAWPTPERIVTGPVVSYGYAGDVWLTARITPPTTLAPGESAAIAASVDWLVCAEICVPEQAALTLSLPVAVAARPAAVAKDFAAAAARMPQPAPGAVMITASGSDIVLSITGLGTDGGPLTGAWFFPAAFGAIADAAPQTFEPTADGLRLKAVRAAGGMPLPPEIAGVLVLDRGRARTGYAIRAQVRS